MRKYQQVPIWTGFGPHPHLDTSKWYNWLLFKIHGLLVREIRRAAEGDTWVSDLGSLEEKVYVWTRRGWRAKY